MAEHKYADVLRAIADGKPVEVRMRTRDAWGNSQDVWGDWQPMDTSSNFSIFGGSEIIEHRVKPKELVKKWRWVCRYRDGDLFVTDEHYTESQAKLGFVCVEKIDATMIEVEAD
jgi:hypothetical protein